MRFKFKRLHWVIAAAGVAAVVFPVGSSASASHVPKCLDETPTIVGTAGDDVLVGTGDDDVIVGLGGNDTIDGLDGIDLICGNEGNDDIDGGPGIDGLVGSAGRRPPRRIREYGSVRRGPGLRALQRRSRRGSGEPHDGRRHRRRDRHPRQHGGDRRLAVQRHARGRLGLEHDRREGPATTASWRAPATITSTETTAMT